MRDGGGGEGGDDPMKQAVYIAGIVLSTLLTTVFAILAVSARSLRQDVRLFLLWALIALLSASQCVWCARKLRGLSRQNPPGFPMVPSEPIADQDHPRT